MKESAKSIKSRLLNIAKTQGDNFNTLLVHYVLQRLLYRLSVSEFNDQFLLKGAWLFVLWNNSLHRPTRDVDLLGFGDNDQARLLDVFIAIASLEVQPDDGLIFDLKSFSAVQIKKDGDYQGVRIDGKVKLDSAIIPLQVDVGFGDAVTPDAQVDTLPCLLDFPAPKLRVYPVYTAIAEKFQAMIHLGLLNSRIKDFYDVYVIAKTQTLNQSDLQAAVLATFNRRGTPVDNVSVLVFSQEFKGDTNKNRQWQAFLKKNRLDCLLTFAQLIELLEKFLLPVYQRLTPSDVDFLDESKQNWNGQTWSWQ